MCVNVCAFLCLKCFSDFFLSESIIVNMCVNVRVGMCMCVNVNVSTCA